MELKNLGQTAASALIHTDIRLEREHWTMFRNKLLGIAAAATLGTAAMLGSTSAYALKILDSAPNDRAGVTAAAESFTYASETLLTTAVTDVKDDSTKYYNVGGTGTVVLSLPGDVPASAGDTYLVSVALDGMVFRTAPTLAAAASGATDATFTVAAGGAAGDKMAVFRKGTTGVINATSILNLTASYAVSTGGGSATVVLTNQSVANLNVPGLSGTKTHGPARVIKVASALKETPTMNNLTATVESGFKKFTDDMTIAHVGSIMVGINGHRVATTGAGTDIVDGLEDIAGTGQRTVGSADVPNSSVSFMGDFSFTEKVFVHGDADCGTETGGVGTPPENTDNTAAADEDDIRNMEGTGDDAVVTNTTKAVNLDATPTDNADNLASFTGYLCIMVQGDDTDDKDAPRIPNTDAYTAMASYRALSDAASGPMGAERALGKISRDGTTVHLPYLTKHENFNQRIRIVNRGSAAARYEMEFHGDGDMAGSDAEGMLNGGEIKVLSLRNDDVVELGGGGSSTSGTLIVETMSTNIDVATVQTNRETGNIDTVVYSAEE